MSGQMEAEIRVIRQPRGGSNVSELSCTFEATEIPGSGTAPVAIYVSWVAPCGTHKTEDFVFEGGTQSFESTYSDGGYPIGMTFWAAISWRDADGQHKVTSNIATCTVR